MLFYGPSRDWTCRDTVFDGPRMRRESTPICERGPHVAGATGTPAANSPCSRWGRGRRGRRVYVIIQSAKNLKDLPSVCRKHLCFDQLRPEGLSFNAAGDSAKGAERHAEHRGVRSCVRHMRDARDAGGPNGTQTARCRFRRQRRKSPVHQELR